MRSSGISRICFLCTIKMYHEAAINILQKTEKHYANWNMDEDGIIGGGAEAYHRELTYNVPLIYSDYFLLKAYFD